MCELELRLIKLPYELGRELAIHVGGNTQNLGGLKFEPLPGSARLYDDHVCLQDVSNLTKAVSAYRFARVLRSLDWIKRNMVGYQRVWYILTDGLVGATRIQ